MITISSTLLQTWIISLILPLTRVLAVIASAPILSHSSIPKRIKLGLGIVLTLIMIPTLPPIPAFDVFSFQGLWMLIQQLIIGAAIGFCMRLVFSAIELAGHLMGMTMGLGFASFFDPQTSGQTTAVSQFLVMLAMLIFLSLDGHLLIVTAIENSFISMPIGVEVNSVDYMKIVEWGSTIFSAGLLLSLPVVTALLITNMALGILTKTAPQLNIFGIGFPITIGVGFIILAVSLTDIVKPISNMIELGTSHMLQVAK
jgi:flagellar biosynthesis protein FliR